MNWLRDLGLSTRKQLMNWGYGARLFLRLLALLPATLKRPALLRDQIHFLGNYSLAIIAVSGLFVGFVLALQGYYILSRFGATEAVGLMVALMSLTLPRASTKLTTFTATMAVSKAVTNGQDLAKAAKKREPNSTNNT